MSTITRTTTCRFCTNPPRDPFVDSCQSCIDDFTTYQRLEEKFAVRPVNTTCRYCGDPIPLFVDSAHYCCRECRARAYNEMERPS